MADLVYQTPYQILPRVCTTLKKSATKRLGHAQIFNNNYMITRRYSSPDCHHALPQKEGYKK
jgi:hypothetical protein